MWTYSQTSGGLVKPDGKQFGFGFAGNGVGLNNPARQSVISTGPLPQATYKMTQWINNDPHLGRCVIVLEPEPGSPMFGRAGFRIHGPRDLFTRGLSSYLLSSNGCIVIGDCMSRKAIWDSGDRNLLVVA